MKNFSQEGEVLTLVAPYDVASGAGLLVGSLFGVATSAALSGGTVEAVICGVYSLKAKAADTATVGTKAYWDNTNKEVTITSAGNSLIGAFTEAKAGAAVLATVRLNGVTV